jgi:hypothetical protein
LSSQQHATTKVADDYNRAKLPPSKWKKSLLGVSILYIFDLSIFNVLDMYKTPGVRMVFSFLHERGVAARSGVLVPILASFEKNLCDRSEDALTL